VEYCFREQVQGQDGGSNGGREDVHGQVGMTQAANGGIGTSWAVDVDDFPLTNGRRKKKKRGRVAGVAVPSPRASGAADRAGSIGTDAAERSALADACGKPAEPSAPVSGDDAFRAALADDFARVLAACPEGQKAAWISWAEAGPVRFDHLRGEVQAAKTACSARATSQRTGGARRK
jgi:hypothetical protein